MFYYLIFWPWFTGLVFLAMGIYSAAKEVPSARGLDKVIVFGRVCAASALAAFGAEHMVNIRAFSPGVPSYIPFHAFWIAFVGLALLAAGLSLAWNRYTKLSCALLAVMLFSFVFMLHIPRLLANPHDRISWAIVLRDSAFASGFLAFAASHAPRRQLLILIGSLINAAAFLFYAPMHILHPQNAPGVPLEKLTPGWMPWPHVLATITALFLLAAAIAIVINKYARVANAWLGAWMIYLTLVLYLPILLTSHGGLALIEGVNYVYDTLLFAGTILLLASALPWNRTTTLKPAPAPAVHATA